jgi:tetratricopeptide (TPR) repeat protein
MNVQKDFFVSYNKADRQWAEWIAWTLEESGYSVVIQAWDFRPGGNFALEMQRATVEAQKTIAVLSEDYLNSAFTQPEWAAAFAQDPQGQKGTLIPVRVQPCKLTGLLASIIYVDLLNLEAEAAQETLLKALLERVKPLKKPQFPGSVDRVIATQAIFPGHSNIPQNLPRSGVLEFVGRDQKLQELHTQLHHNESSAPRVRLVITAIAGMGGIGKTELALQYAIAQLQHQTYPAGLCWLTCRAQEIATQIVSFAKTKLLLTIPDDLEAKEQVDLIWRCWPEGNALLILDDVTDYDAITPYLPPSDPRFKVLITTRQNFGASVTAINIEELSDEAAIVLLKSIVGDERIEAQQGDAQALCKWVGNLPLGLELLGRFLVGKPDWAIAKLLERLESKRLAAKALIETESGMTATLGVAAALELSWAELSQPQQDLACLLGMFAVAPIPWSLVEPCFPEVDSDDLEDWRDEGLRDRSLIKRVDQGTYQLHQVVQEFFRTKLQGKGEFGDAIKSSFCAVMVAQAKTLDQTPTLDQIERVRGAIAHLEETVNQWLESLPKEDMIVPFEGIESFYQGQGNYELAEPRYLQALERLKELLGNDHSSVAISLNNLATLYSNQGRYEESELLYLEALERLKKLLGNDHPDVATSLNNLARLYYLQGRYEESEPLYLEALELRKQLLGNGHSSVAHSLNSLATLYSDQGRYEESEPLCIEALELCKKLLGNDHPDVATSLNSLARLYDFQGRYETAEPLYLQALELCKKLLGNNHLFVATSLNNLATLYEKQGRYEAAELLFLEALELSKKLLDNDHPDVATSYYNLGVLYHQQGQYQKAKSLYVPALQIYEQRLGQTHPDTQALLSWLNKLPKGTEALPLEELGL